MAFEKKAANKAVGDNSFQGKIEAVEAPVYRHNTVKIGTPGIVWFAPSDRGGTPSPAVVTKAGGNGVLALTVFPHNSGMKVVTARYWKDKEFDKNPELEAFYGSWAFYDEI